VLLPLPAPVPILCIVVPQAAMAHAMMSSCPHLGGFFLNVKENNHCLSGKVLCKISKDGKAGPTAAAGFGR
jgi:hypothetical protein